MLRYVMLFTICSCLHFSVVFCVFIFSEKMRLTLSVMRLSSKLAERLEKYGRYYPSPLTIQHFVDFGNY